MGECKLNSEGKASTQLNGLQETDRAVLMNGLDGIISQTLQDKIWEMIWKRWCAYEDLAIRDESAEQQRIVPPDRQNLGQVLRDNHLKEYEEFGLLMLSMGRCSQDDYYLVPIEEKQLPRPIRKRFTRLIEDVVPLENFELLVFFRDGAVKKCSIKDRYAVTHGLFRCCFGMNGSFMT